jgi:hypothetical protein
VPFLCLAAAYFIAESAGWAARLVKRPQWQPTLAAFGVAAALWLPVQSVVAFDSLMARTDSRLLAREWVERRFPAGTTIAQLGPGSGQLFFHDESEVPYRTVPFSRDAVRPDIVVVPYSPVIEAPDLGGMDHVLATEYELGYATEVDLADPRNVYDLQDEFYLPLAGFHKIERPGPNLKIYVRRRLASALPGS